MRKQFLALLSGALVVVLSVGVGASTAGGASTAAQEPAARGSDNLSSPLAEKQDALRAVRRPRSWPRASFRRGRKVAQVAKGQYVQLAREGEDSIWTVPGRVREPDQPTYGGSRSAAQPDPAARPHGRQHDDLDERLQPAVLPRPALRRRTGRELDAELLQRAVVGPVRRQRRRDRLGRQVPNNEACYGNELLRLDRLLDVRGCSSATRSTPGSDAQVQPARPSADHAYLAQFDIWDRYDYDGDGNFNEPDGYIDHFQSIHAGDGRGGRRRCPGHGRDLVAPLVRVLPGSPAGPDGAGPHGFRGVRIGNTNYWIGDYTIEPENGGVGVFSHEFGARPRPAGRVRHVGQHRRRRELDRLLDADVAGLVRHATATADGIGDRRSHMSAWDKFQLGWLNYEVARAGQEVRAQARAGGVQHEAGPGCVRSAAGQGRHARTSGLRTRARTSTTRAPRTTSTTRCRGR